MKPVNDKFFGSASGQIAVAFHDGSTTVSGHIVKQVGTSTYVVSDGSTTRRARLAQTTAAAATLVDGAMRIVGTGTGSGATLVATYEIDTVTVLAGGTGYAVSNVLTGVGGTAITPFTATVSTVSTGAVTGVTITNRGEYTAVPGTLSTNVRQVTTTGGAGTGATLNVTFRLRSITVSAGGSGYLAGQVITYTGLGGTAPTITVGSVDSAGAILTLNVASPGATIFTFASAISPEPATLYIKKLDALRAHATTGSSYSWRLGSEAATSGYVILSTI